ncbi:nuclear transcription factor Y subunit B-1 [Dendrobium catenatum]|uniref:Nuclear transcription factor Y subunit B-3 n=1 Tax=Dendrobium catenatum TaxID=906689 RepID=A0A2I0W5H4_9ASPA|nr:nuclear transcription factor Y subunit B-1 [Dendrobium catenatum]PKU70907.1 Nuclear transcription factor Y subunit B-3 [Dendrobium catenatum]
MKRSRKSTSQQSPASSPQSDADMSGSSKEQDRFLPIANVSRIMKRSLPANAKISKEAKETVQECVSEFISFVTGEASDKCQREKRKTINGDDLLWAMSTLGFDSYVVPLRTYLNRYRESEGDKNCMARQQEPENVSGDRDQSLSFEDGSGVTNEVLAATAAAAARFDGGFYNPAPGFGGGRGFLRKNGSGAHDGGQGGGRPAFPGQFHGSRWNPF